MENLGDFIPKSGEAENLGDFATPGVVSSKPLPDSAVKNRAAAMAAISQAQDGGFDIYNRIMQENQIGVTATADSIRQQATERVRQQNYQHGVIPILSDVNAKVDEKQRVLDSFFADKSKEDSLLTLSSDSLSAASDGESADAENGRVAQAPDLVKGFQASYSREQALVNSFKRDLTQQATVLGQGLDIAQQFLPLSQGISAFSFTNELAKKLGKESTFGDKAKAILRPGATYEDARNTYESLSGEERVQFVQTLIDTIKDSKGVIFSTDSQFDAMNTLEKVVGNYSPLEASFDTVTNALDIIGVGFLLRKGARAISEARKVGSAKIAENATEGDLVPSGGVPFEPKKDLTIQMANPEKDKLPAMYKQKEDLIADSSGVLPNRSVSNLNAELNDINQKLDGINSAFKDEAKRLQVQQKMSRKEAESSARKMLGDQETDLNLRKQRVENLLEQNRKGQKAQDKISALEDEIARIESLPDKDGIVRINPITDAINRMDRNSLVGIENPASVGSILLKTNPEKGRNALLAAFTDTGDEMASALFGTSKTEAMANAFMPKQVTESGVISAKPVNVMGSVEQGADSLLEKVKNAVNSEGSSAFTSAEQARAANTIINDFKNPTGLQVFDGMDGFNFSHKDGTVKISSVYGSKGGPFSNAEDAINSAKISLKEYGDLGDNVTLLKQEGGNYVPTTLAAEKGKSGNYLVKLEYSRDIGLKDVKKAGPLDQFKARWNLLDAVPAFVSEKMGSLTRHFINAGGIFDKHLTTAANIADVMTARLEKILQTHIREIAGDLKKLPKKEADQLSAYFVEANEKGIPLSLSDFARRGFTEGQYEVATKWREYWDSIYYLQDKDLRKSLTNQGYQLFDNGSDRMFAKPIGKDITKADGIYDPDTGKIISMSREEMDKLYQEGGTFAHTRSKFKVDGAEVDHIVVKNTPNSMLRGFSDGDHVLNYRDGYYTTSYKAPIFIDKIDPKTGKAYAVATARDTAEAEQYIKRAKIEDPDAQFAKPRPDKKRLLDHKEDVWSLQEQGGMSAQRRRGQPLIEADGSNRLEGAAYFDGPFESAVRASRSISGRTMYRDVIDTAKARAMEKHGHLFPKSNGMTQYPSKISDISSPAGPFTKEVRDARTDFEYINYLENGYINGLDNMFKTIFGVMAEGLGQASVKVGGKAGKALSMAERAAIAAETSLAPTKLGKFAVFNAYIASAMFRQWLVQPAQLVRMMAYNPLGFNRMINYMYDYARYINGASLEGDSAKFVKFAENSGFLDSVDKSNLVRGTLTTSGEQKSAWEKTGGRLFNPLRILGYDLGEKMNILGHSAAVFEKYLREGKDVTSKSVQHEMIGKISALSYDMRFSGDMPYNQNSLALFTQFLQVPHKALLQGLDRRLTPVERTRMVIGDAIIYGGAGAAITSMANSLFGEDFLNSHPQVKEVIVDGAMQSTINTALNNIMGWVDLPKGELDINGSFSPFDFAGYKKMFAGLLTDGGLMSAISNTPIGGMMIKDGNKVQKAIMSVARSAGFVPDSEIHPTTVMEALNSVAEITTGWSNIHKAALAYEMNKIMTKNGQVLVNGLSPIQILAQAFGIQPKEIGEYYENSLDISKTKKDYEKEVRNAARTAIEVAVGKTHIGMENKETRDIVTSLLMHKYRDKPEAWRFINQEFNMAIQDPKVGLLNSAIKSAAFPEYNMDRETLTKILGPEGMKKYDQWQANINAAKEVK